MRALLVVSVVAWTAAAHPGAAEAQTTPSVARRVYVGVGAGVSTSPSVETDCGSPYLCGDVAGSTVGVSGVVGGFVGTILSVGVETWVGGSISGEQQGQFVPGGRAVVAHRQTILTPFVRVHSGGAGRRVSVESVAGLAIGFGITSRDPVSGPDVASRVVRLGFSAGADVVSRGTRRFLLSAGGRLHYLPRDDGQGDGAADAGVSNWLVVFDFKLRWMTGAFTRSHITTRGSAPPIR